VRVIRDFKISSKEEISGSGVLLLIGLSIRKKNVFPKIVANCKSK
jgi:hypothetical protein